MSLRIGISLTIPGMAINPMRDVVGQIERAGADTLAVGQAVYDPFVLASALAASTETARLMTAVATTERQPHLTAQSARSVQELSGGRFALGLGVGQDRGRGVLGRLADYIHTVRSALPDVSIHIAAARTGMARLASDVADGVLISRVHTKAWLTERVFPELSRGIERGVLVRCAVGSDRPTLVHLLRREIIQSTPDLLAAVAAGSGFDIGPSIALRQAGELDASADALPRSLVEEMCLIGTPEECCEQLARYAGHVDWVSLFPSGHADPATALRRATSVLRLQAARSSSATSGVIR